MVPNQDFKFCASPEEHFGSSMEGTVRLTLSGLDFQQLSSRILCNDYALLMMLSM